MKPQYSEHPSISLFQKDCTKEWKTLGEFLEKYSDNDETHWTRPTADLGIQLQGIPEGSGLKSKGRIEATRPNGHWGIGKEHSLLIKRNLREQSQVLLVKTGYALMMALCVE